MKTYRRFDHFAPVYDWLTNNALWRDSVREMARHLPPSAATLRLCDIGCGPAGSAILLAQLRPDASILGVDGSAGMLRTARQTIQDQSVTPRIRLLQADALQLPLTDDSTDAITAHSVFYMLSDQRAFLAEAMRVLRPGGRLIMLDPAEVRYPLGVLRTNLRAAPGVLLWHTVSRAYRQYTPESSARLLENAGFARVLGERAVEGYAILSRGEKPYPASTPIQRTTTTAGRDQTGTLSPIDLVMAVDQTRGRSLYLLIQQTPNKPVWTLKPDEVLIWGAATVSDNGTPVALAFSSLPKAVEFMQPAVRDNLMIGINKVAKFDPSVAQTWDFPVLLNPSLAGLRAETRYTLPGPQIGIDPSTAITGEE